MQKAKIDYEVLGDTPSFLYRKILENLTIGDSVQNMPRPTIHITGGDKRKKTDYVKSSKAFRDGKINKAEVHFPVRLGSVAYINAIPAADAIVILFRHDSIMANHYENNGKQYGEHYQPYFYFTVTVNTKNNHKNYRVIQSIYNVDGRVFPHTSSGMNGVYKSNCDGDYAGQLQDTLKEADLSVFLSVFAGYIRDGTRISDEYGQSYEYFRKTVSPRNSQIHITNKIEAQLFSYVVSDPEIPFKYNTTGTRISLDFHSKDIYEAYLQHAQINSGVGK